MVVLVEVAPCGTSVLGERRRFDDEDPTKAVTDESVDGDFDVVEAIIVRRGTTPDLPSPVTRRVRSAVHRMGSLRTPRHVGETRAGGLGPA